MAGDTTQRNPAGTRGKSAAAASSTPTPVTALTHNARIAKEAGQRTLKGQPGYAGKPLGGGK